MNRTLCFLIVATILWACSGDPGNQPPLTLNQGEKWVVNDEMKPHILRAESVLNDYISLGKTDHQALAKQLKRHNDDLIKNCTMKGRSHNELHKWLYPHVELIQNLETAANQEAAEQAVDRLKSSFEQYHRYFQ